MDGRTHLTDRQTDYELVDGNVRPVTATGDRRQPSGFDPESPGLNDASLGSGLTSFISKSLEVDAQFVHARSRTDPRIKLLTSLVDLQ